MDIETRALRALDYLPDRAARDVRPGEMSEYLVVRVAVEIVIDLMRSAGGIEYAAAVQEAHTLTLQGVEIPFVSPKMLLRMKTGTHREKDALDLVFLRRLLARRGYIRNPAAGDVSYVRGRK